MYIQSIETTQGTLGIFYPTLYIAESEDKSVTINSIVLQGIQNLEINNIVTLQTVPNLILPITKNN